MKYLHAATMLLVLIGIFVLMQLGFAYHYEGHGLHPAICAITIAVMLGLGYASACNLATLEE